MPVQRKQRVERVALHCEECGTDRYMRPCERKQRSRFCSQACSIAHLKRFAQGRPVQRKLKFGPVQVPINCAQCGIRIWRWKAELTKVSNSFCSTACTGLFNRTGFDYQAWRAANIERDRARRREWSQKNPDKVKAIKAKWRYQNRDKTNLAAKVRRTALPRKLDYQKFAARLQATNGVCVYCGLKYDKLEADHVRPVARGGTSKLSNFIPCCRSCNASKGAKDVTEWLEQAHGLRGLARAMCFLDRRKVPAVLLEPASE